MLRGIGKRLISGFTIFVLFINLFVFIPAKNTVEAAGSNDIYELVKTDYGVSASFVNAKELNLLSDNIEVIDPQISNLLFLKEDLNGDVFRLYIFGPNGLIKTLELSSKADSNIEWIDRLRDYSSATQTFIRMGSYGWYSDCIYKVLNSAGKYDLLNLTTGKYYDYNFDSISSNNSSYKDSLIEYKIDGLIGLLDCHGEKLTGAMYSGCCQIRDDYYLVTNTLENSGYEGYYGILSADGRYSGDLIYTVNNYRTKNNEVSKLICMSTTGGIEQVIYPDLNKVIDIAKHTFVQIGYDTAILTEYDDNSRSHCYILNNKGIKEDVCDLFGGEYSTASYTKDGRMINIYTYNRYYDSTKRATVNQVVTSALIDTNYKKIYDGYSYSVDTNSGWSGEFYGEYGWIRTCDVSGNYQYIIVDKTGDEIYSFEPGNNNYNVDFIDYTKDSFVYTSKYILLKMVSGKSILINASTGRVIEYPKGTNIELSEKYIIAGNQYAIITTSDKKQILCVDTGNTYDFDSDKVIIMESYTINGNGYFIVSTDSGNMILDNNLKKIMDIDQYYKCNGSILICKDSRLYGISGELLDSGSWAFPEFSSFGIFDYEPSILVKARKKTDEWVSYRKEMYVYMDMNGDIVSDNNYYVSELRDGLGFFAKCGEESIYDKDLDEFGIINGDGDVLIRERFGNRFYYPDRWGWSEGIHDVEVGGQGIILRKNDGTYVLYSWEDYEFVSKKAPKPISVVGDDAGMSSSKLKLGTKFKFEVPSEFPVIGGEDIELDLSFVPVQFECEENIFRIGIGTKDIKKYPIGDWNNFKKFVDTQNEDLRKGVNALLAANHGVASMGFDGVKPKVSCYGYAEGVITSEGIQSIDGKLMIEIKVKAENEWQTLVVAVPVVIKASGEVGAKVTASVGLDFEKGYMFIDGALEMTVPKIRLSAGIGVAYIADVSVYGTLEHKLTISKKSTSRNIDYTGTKVESLLSGEAGVSVNVLFASYEKALWESGEKKYTYDFSFNDDDIEHTNNEMINTEYANSYMNSYQPYTNMLYEKVSEISEPDVFDEYSLEREDSNWVAGEKSESTYLISEINTLASDVYNEANPILLQLENGTKVIIYTADISERITGNHTAIVYSIFDENISGWSAPKILDDDGTADFYPSAIADGDDVIVAWSNSSKVFANEEIASESFLTDMASSCEIEVAVLNVKSGDVKTEILTDDDKTDLRPQLAKSQGEIVATWYKNENNDVFCLSGTNYVYGARKNVDDWTVSLVSEIKKPIISIGVGEFNEMLGIMYLVREDSDSSATTLNFVDFEGNISTILNETICNRPVFGDINGKSAIIWQAYGENNGNLYYINAIGQSPKRLFPEDYDITMDYRYISGNDYQVLMYTDYQDDDTKNLYAYVIKENQVGDTIRLTQIDDYVENPVGIIDDNGLEIAFLRKKIVVTNDTMKDNTDLCMLNVKKKSALEIDNIEYNQTDMIPGADAKLHVTIKNNGMKDCQNGRVSILYGEKVIGYEELENTILPGNTESIEIDVTIPLDLNMTNSFKAVAECDDYTDSETISLGYNDLELSMNQEEDEFVVSILNSGGFDEAAKLVIYENDTSGVILKTYQLGKIEAGQSINKTLNMADMKALGKNLYINVETDNADDELYTCNNYAYIYTGNNMYKYLDHIRLVKENTRYQIGDSFNADDLTVYAVYNDNSEEIITDYRISTDEIDMSSEGAKSIKITYEKDYIVRSASFDIEVVSKEKESEPKNDSGKNGQQEEDDNIVTDDQIDAEGSYADDSEENRNSQTGTDNSQQSFVDSSDGTPSTIYPQQANGNTDSKIVDIGEDTSFAPAKVKKLSAKNKKGKKIIISWKWQDGINKYQIQYALNKKFTKKRKTKTVAGYNDSTTISKLKKGKTYYVRVRAGKKSSGKMVYGKWSAVKKVKIKK